MFRCTNIFEDIFQPTYDFISLDGVSLNDKVLCQSSSIDDKCFAKIENLSSFGYFSDDSLDEEDNDLQQSYITIIFKNARFKKNLLKTSIKLKKYEK